MMLDSGHEVGTVVSIAASALGINSLERHITLIELCMGVINLHIRAIWIGFLLELLEKLSKQWGWG